MGTIRNNLHSGRLIGGLCVVFYLIFCLAWTLNARLFLQAYYWSANAAVMGLPVGVTLLLHCTCCRTGVWETLWPNRNTWHVFSELYMFLTWVLFLLLFLLFTALTAIKPTVNQDTVISAIIYLIAFLMLSASHLITSEGLKRQSISYVPTIFKDSEGRRSFGRRCLRMTRRVCRILLSSVLLLLLLVFTIVLVGSLYEAVGSIRDWNFYRPFRFLVTVTVPPHLPAAFYLRCQGPDDGKTVLMEQGLMGMSLLAYEFIPTSLAKAGFRACVYDRRGIGWTDPIETDRISMVTMRQNSASNVLFLKAVVEKANLTTPLILAGHSYGGWHITRYALAYPDEVEALVYIDASRFTQTNSDASGYDSLDRTFRIVSNFVPTGLIRLAIETRLIDFLAQFASFIDLKDLSDGSKTEVIASLLGGSYFSRGIVEKRHVFTGGSLNDVGQASALASRLPILVIDVNSEWFPKPANVSKYYTYVHMPSATHTSIVYSKQWGSKVAQEIVKFIAKFS